MSRYLLDTNICVHLLKNDAKPVARIRLVGTENCWLSEITVAELLYGVALSAPERREANRRQLTALLAELEARILPISGALAVYAEQKAQLRRMGRPTGDLDLLIGSTALAHDLTLATRNTKDFVNLSGLRLENWVDG